MKSRRSKQVLWVVEFRIKTQDKNHWTIVHKRFI